MGLPGSEDSLTIGCAVLTQYQRVTDRRTDVQPIAITCVSLLTQISDPGRKTSSRDTELKCKFMLPKSPEGTFKNLELIASVFFEFV